VKRKLKPFRKPKLLRSRLRRGAALGGWPEEKQRRNELCSAEVLALCVQLASREAESMKEASCVWLS